MVPTTVIPQPRAEEVTAPRPEFPAERVSSKDFGLAAGLLLGRVLFDTDELHFGYWDQGLEVKITNMPAAQERYSEVLLSHIPPGTRTILDVGCGAGKLAERLLAAGYDVECVCPSPLLVGEARKRLGDAVPIHLMTYEEFDTERRFDLVLFSESFQYCKLPGAVERSARFLRPGGHLMICDFFRRDVPGKRWIRGGHSWAKFRQALSGTAFEGTVDEDITEWTAPTQDIANDVSVRLVGPMLQVLRASMRTRRPWVTRALEWVFRKKLAKMERKYFSGVRSSEHFREFLTYRLLVYRLAGEKGA